MRGATYDYYQVLGVSEDATLHDIKLRYRLLSKKYHPDTPGGNERAMARINEAYAVLSDPLKRSSYRRPQPPKTTYTHATTEQRGQKPVSTKEQDQEPANGWAIFFAYVLAIPIAILLVTILTPLANRVFTRVTNNAMTQPGNVVPTQQAAPLSATKQQVQEKTR